MSATGHLTEERLLDAVEYGAGAEGRAHIEACAECRARLDEARAGLTLAREADVPEPSPLYWEAFRRQVGRRIVEERPRWHRWLVPLAAATAVLTLAVPILDGPVPESPAVPVLPAWSALPPADEDEGLAVLKGLGVAEADLAAVGESSGLDEALGDLSDEEQDAFADLLRRRMQEGTL